MSPTILPQSKPASERLYLFDLMRFVAMVMMMQGHTLDSLVRPSELDLSQFPWNIWLLLRGLTAPVFLLISGIVHVFAMKRDDDGRVARSFVMKRFRWAISLVGIGYLMLFPAARIFDLKYVAAETWSFFLQVNVLHLTGAAMLIVILLSVVSRRLKSLGYSALVASLFVFCLAPFINTTAWLDQLPVGIANYFSYTHGSLFPIFPFAGYMFAGVAIGSFMKSIESGQRFGFIKSNAWWIGAMIFLLGGIVGTLTTRFALFPQHEFAFSNPAVALMRSGIIIFMMTPFALIYRLTLRWKDLYSVFGQKSLYIYVIHLILLYGCPWFPSVVTFNYRALHLWQGGIIAVAVIGLTLTMVYSIDYTQKHLARTSLVLRYSLGTLLAFALLH